MGEGCQEPTQEAGADDAREHEPCRDRRDAGEPERQPQLLGPRGAEIDRHAGLIGKTPASLERVTRFQRLFSVRRV